MNNILWMLLEITIFSGVIFALIMLFKKAFKNKISPMLHLWIWVLLIIRLMLPITFESGMRIFVIPNEVQTVQVAAPTPVTQNTGGRQLNSGGVTPPAQITSNKEANLPAPTIPSQSSSVATPAFNWDVGKTLILAWLFGVGILLIRIGFTYRNIVMQTKLRGVRPTQKLLGLLEQCKKELGITQRVYIIAQKNMASPALLFPNIILMPVDVLNMDVTQIKMAILHELTHFKRKDHILSVLLLTLRTVYWFNPFIWLAFKQIRADIETACDNDVVKQWCIEERNTYAYTVLQMFDRAKNKQLVLGMALGGTRKNAEQRIRGIYMESKSKRSIKAVAVITSLIIAFGCFTTACKPTPQKPIVVNKSESFDKIIESGENIATIDPNAPPYTVPEKWTDSIVDGKITIEVDTPIELPVQKGFPVAIMAQQTFSQEEVNKLVDYFAKGRKLYKLPMLETKEQIMVQITEAKQARAQMASDPENPISAENMEQLDSHISQLEQNYANAPEANTKEYVDATLTNMVQSNGVVFDENKDYLNVAVEPNEESQTIKYNNTTEDDIISVANANDKNAGTSFGYRTSNSFYNESFYKNNLDAPDIDASTDPNFKDWENQLSNTTMTKEEAISACKQIMADLGIEGLGLYKLERVAFFNENINPVKGGYYLEFNREINGLVGFGMGGWGSSQSHGEKLPEYAPPFTQETLNICINEDGLHMFNWYGKSTIQETVNQNAELIPFEDVQQAAINQIKYKKSFMINNGPYTVRAEITSARLNLGYIQVKDDTTKAMMVPLWIFEVTEYITAEGDKERRGNKEAVAINALDGSVVNTTAIATSMEYELVGEASP